MKQQYTIIPQNKLDMIIDIKDALADDLNPYLSRLIEHFLEHDVVQFRTSEIQADIADLIEKHEINVR